MLLSRLNSNNKFTASEYRVLRGVNCTALPSRELNHEIAQAWARRPVLLWMPSWNNLINLWVLGPPSAACCERLPNSPGR